MKIWRLSEERETTFGLSKREIKKNEGLKNQFSTAFILMSNRSHSREHLKWLWNLEDLLQSQNNKQ